MSVKGKQFNHMVPPKFRIQEGKPTEQPACIFCGIRHNFMYCSSPILTKLDKMEGWLGWNVCPDFSVHPINELRYIALRYSAFEKAMPWPYDRFSYGGNGNRYNREFGYNPIPIALNKPRMIKALVERWKGFETFRANRDAGPVEVETNCPVCMDDMVKTQWCDKFAKHRIYQHKILRLRGKVVHPHLTRCNHRFCGVCWDTFLQTNVKQKGYVNHVWNDTEYVACPMCRAEILVERLPPTIRVIQDISGNFHNIVENGPYVAL